MSVASPWSPQAVDRLKALVAHGHSYSQAAKALSTEFGRQFTRNAVCAKIDWLDMNRPKPPTLPKGLRAPDVKRDVHASAGANFGKVNVEIRADRKEAPRPTSPPDSIATSPKSIAHPDFCRRACKWPIMARDADGDIQFCQEPSGGAVYCAEHKLYSRAASLPKSIQKIEAEINATNRKAGAGAQANQLIFSPRAA